MSLDDWLRNDWLKRHQTTKAELDGLLAIVDRELKIAKSPAYPLTADSITLIAPL